MTTEQTPAFLTFAAALLVALVTAWTTDRRQTQALSAEGSRLSQHLEHENRLQDVEHLRDFLDEAAAAYEGARIEMVAHAVRLRRGPLEAELMRKSLDAQVAVGVIARRSSLRYVAEYPVQVAYAALEEAIKKQCQHLFDWGERLSSETDEGGPSDGPEEDLMAAITAEEDKVDTQFAVEATLAFKAFASAVRNGVKPLVTTGS